MDHSDSYRREVTAKVETGWRIEEETQDRVTLVQREFGDPNSPPHRHPDDLVGDGRSEPTIRRIPLLHQQPANVIWKDRPEADVDEPATSAE